MANRHLVLLMGHGTRDPEGVTHFVHLLEAVRKAAPDRLVDAGFLEFGGAPVPFIEHVIEQHIANGVQQILAVPILLHDAGHSNQDMPRVVREARERYSEVEIAMSAPLGVAPCLLEIVEERIADLDTCLGIRRADETSVLLVGRGATHPVANGDFFKIGRLLWERNRFQLVECAFVSLTQPTVPAGIERCARLGARRLFVMPYFLHTGVLVKRIAEQAHAAAAQLPEVEVAVGEPLGVHPNLVGLILDRVTNAYR